MKGFREEDRVRLARDLAETKWSRANDAWESITWTILHDETCGFPMNETGTVRGYVWDGARSIDLPSIEVIYEIQLDLIIIHEADFRDAPYRQAGRA
ncbi:hypothetical protein GCM10010869_19620 [Mesorhizobium tianshanense]|uniref:Uncharacterized protein n=1 Tax=Mesorhizobium tianshanense TaxID=39844 RepID=A0A562N3H2_9HYPH|nr:hypothetical protein IQ26_05919 [Mesorhizobium tianshanense]GLS36373.1 hypothetical protein GCM10010869_19620 [Mesorhizobium tianshanense]